MSVVAKPNEIIKGLREYVEYVPSIDGVAILMQAADLIESLQAELQNAQIHADCMEARATAFEAELNLITSERNTLKAAMGNWHEGEAE